MRLATPPAFLRPVLVAAALLAPLAPARAQGGLQPEPTVWLTYAGEHALTRGGTALVLDAHVRRADAFADWRQLLLRTGVSRGIGERVRVAGGWAYLRTFATDAAPGAVWDHRAWQMVQLSHGSPRLALVHRVRMEQRFFRGEATAPEDGAPDWAFAWRARYQVRATTALPWTVGTGGRAYLVASQELFAPFGPHEGTPEIDQSRTGIGIGARVAPMLRVELGYLNRATVADGRARTRDHALQVAIASSAPLFARPSAP